MAGTEPNLFIVGAPKAGTTALGRYLGSHPDVFVAGRELSYFGTDLDFRTRRGAPWRIGWDEYLTWFTGQEATRYRVDRSVFYLYSRCAAAEIRARLPDSRVIALVRNPVDQMHSEHSEMLFQGEEDIADFAAALSAEPERLAGGRVPPGCQHTFGLYYRSLAGYAEQLERYVAAFGRSRVHVVVHDDLVADPESTYRAVLAFLELDPSHRPALGVANPNKVARSALVRRALRTTSPGLRRAGRLLVPGAAARARLRRRAQELNTRYQPRRPLDPRLRATLAEEFVPEVRRLEALLERDLSAWMPARAPGLR